MHRDARDRRCPQTAAACELPCRLAIAIGALAPKLRLANILALEWGTHLDRGMRYITVEDHKTKRATRAPLVVPVSDQLRRILRDARTRNPTTRHVVTYRGSPITEIRGGVRFAAQRAGLPYGRFVTNGLTFHTLRHTAATILAELEVEVSKRQAVMGHRRVQTTQLYTHLRPTTQQSTVEQRSAALPIDDLVTVPWKRARNGGTLGKILGTPGKSPAESRANRGVRRLV